MVPVAPASKPMARKWLANTPVTALLVMKAVALMQRVPTSMNAPALIVVSVVPASRPMESKWLASIPVTATLVSGRGE